MAHKDDCYYEQVETSQFQAKFRSVALEDATSVVYTPTEINNKFAPAQVEWSSDRNGGFILFVTDHVSICKYALDQLADPKVKLVPFSFLIQELYKETRDMHEKHGLRYSKARNGFVRAAPAANKKVDGSIVLMVKTYIKRHIERSLSQKFNLDLTISGNGTITLHNAIVLAKAHNLNIVTVLFPIDTKYKETLLTVPLLLSSFEKNIWYKGDQIKKVPSFATLSQKHQQDLIDIINKWWSDATEIKHYKKD